MNKKKILLIAVVALLSVFAIFQLKKNYDKNTASSANMFYNDVTVTTANVIRQKASLSLNFTGTLYAYKELDVAAETAGNISSLQFTLGKHVQKGSVLAVIDDKTKRLNYESAQLTAERLKKDYERIQNLYKGGSASEQELDNARTSYETARISMEQAEKQYADTKIKSSIAGVITDKKIEEGSYVNTGNIIATVVDISRLKVKFNASETNVYSLKVGEKVLVTTDVYPDVQYHGTITFISARADDSHNYAVEVEMQNSSQNPLKAGTFVNADITLATGKCGLYIPRSALQGSIKEAKVYTSQNDKAVLKNIVIGEHSGASLQVLSGLTESDRVIVSGQVNLTDGKTIKIINNN